MFLSELLHPMHPNKFREEILGKRFYYWRAPVGSSDRYSTLFSWQHFENYLNNWQNANHVQLAGMTPKGEPKPGHKWDKGKDGTLSKAEVYNYWRHGHSIVLPFCEYQSRDLWTVNDTIERAMPFGRGCANMYCSSRVNSKTFEPHRDSTENFLFHIDGIVEWTFYEETNDKKNLKKTNSFILGKGDLLYIPIGLWHSTKPLGPRLTASVHFQPKPEKVIRDKMYDWYRWFEYQREVKL